MYTLQKINPPYHQRKEAKKIFNMKYRGIAAEENEDERDDTDTDLDTDSDRVFLLLT